MVLSDCNEEAMPRSYTSLTLDDAKHMLQAAEVAAAKIGIAYNIAVVDAGGNLIAFVRQDGALIGSSAPMSAFDPGCVKTRCFM